MAVYKKLLLSAGGGVISSLQQARQNPNLATLYIGLGGTGVKCIRNIKTQVYNRLQADDPHAYVKEYSHIRFLGVDTDNDSLSAGDQDGNTKETEKLLGLDVTEQMSIANSAIGAAIKNINAIRLRPELHWLSPDIDEVNFGDKGAGGIRQVGRYMLIDRSEDFLNKVKTEIQNAMRGLSAPTVIINICTGLGGGTGSGCFLDTCYLVRQALADLNVTAQVFGFFFLPEVNLSRIPMSSNAYQYVQMNGYAAMQELDYCMNLPKNGGAFSQTYRNNRVVAWDAPPVKMAFLIGATKSGDVLDNAYDYAMNVVAEYSLDILTDMDEENTDKFGAMSQLSNFTAFVNVTDTQKVIGAELHYLILGASCAIVPFKEINTYLASAVFEEFSKQGDRVPTEQEVAEIARETMIDPIYTGVAKNDILRALYTEIKKGVSMKSFYDDDCWKEVWDSLGYIEAEGKISAFPEFNKHYEDCVADAEKAISTNAASMADSNNTGSVIGKICSKLDALVCDIQYGAGYASRVIDAAVANNMGNIITGLIAQNKELMRHESIQPRFRQCTEAIDKMGRMKTKGKYRDFKEAYEAWIEQDINLRAYEALGNVLVSLNEQLAKKASSYYNKLKTISDTLNETFRANKIALDGDNLVRENSYTQILVDVSDTNLRASLDRNVAAVNMTGAFSMLMKRFLENYEVWKDLEEAKIANLVTEFFVQDIFSGFANRTLAGYLMEKYDTDNPQQLTNILYREWVSKLTEDAKPLFSFNRQVWEESQCSAMAYLSVSSTSDALQAAAQKMNEVNKVWEVKKTAHEDRIFVMYCSCALPLGANTNAMNYAGLYYQSNHAGRHYYEDKQYGALCGSEIRVNWSDLPSVVPQSLILEEAAPLMLQNQLAKVKALYNDAVDAGVFARMHMDENNMVVANSDIMAPAPEDVQQYEAMMENARTMELKNVQQLAEAADLAEKLRSPDTLRLQKTAELRKEGSRTQIDIMDSIRRDYLAFSPVYQKKVRDILDQIAALREKACQAADALDARIARVRDELENLPRFCNALFCGVIQVEGNKLWYARSGGLMGSKNFELASSTADNGDYNDVLLYQAYLNYKALDGEIRQEILKAVNARMDSGDDAVKEPVEKLRGGLLSANKVSMAAENANGHSDGGAILDFYTALCTRFEKYL